MLLNSKNNWLPVLALCSVFSGTSVAQVEVADTLPEYEVDRNAAELNDRVKRPDDTDIFDTAILFSSYDRDPGVVHCVAFNARGERIGRARTKVPSNGVKLMFASDISKQFDFLGKVTCRSRGQIHGSAYLLGPVFSDLEASTVSDRAGSTIRVPVALNR